MPRSRGRSCGSSTSNTPPARLSTPRGDVGGGGGGGGGWGAGPAEELLTTCGRAAGRCMEGDLPLGEDGGTQSPTEYVDVLSATSGLPYALCRRNMAKIHQVLTQMPT